MASGWPCEPTATITSCPTEAESDRVYESYSVIQTDLPAKTPKRQLRNVRSAKANNAVISFLRNDDKSRSDSSYSKKELSHCKSDRTTQLAAKNVFIR